MKTFEKTWAGKVAEGYQYGAEALEQVRFGWEICLEATDDEERAAWAALRELLAIVDEKDARGEPAIGEDHTGVVNWLLDFAERVRPLVGQRPSPRGSR